MANKSLSFPQSIQATQSLMNKIETEKLDESTIEKEISTIVNTKNGGRGFFVAYLTSDMSLADNPSSGVINGLKAAKEVVNELLVKNLAMSAAMAVAHNRNHDLDNVKGSQKVIQRTSNLIQKINSDTINNELKKLQDTIVKGQGEYEDFLERWNYDLEQKQAIQQAISDTLI